MKHLGISMLRNFGWISGSEAINFGLSFFIIVIITRSLGVAGFGAYSFLFAVMTILTMVVDMGLTPLLVREVSQERGKASLYLWNALVVKGGIALAVWAVIAVLFYVNKMEGMSMAAVILAWVWMLMHSVNESLRGVFRAFERMEYDAIAKLITSGSLLLALLLLRFFEFSIQNVFLAYVLSTFAALAYLLRVFTRTYTTNGGGIQRKVIFSLLGQSWPFALSAFFVSVYYYIDTIILAYLTSELFVGWYSAAYRIILVAITGSSMLITLLYPYLSRSYKEDRKTFDYLVSLGVKAMLLLGIPMGILVSVYASPLINMLFGAEYDMAAPVLRILIWSVVLLYMYGPVGIALSASNRQTFYLLAVATGAGMNVLLNLLLIPRMGYIGAALATVITELLVGSCMVAAYMKHHRILLWGEGMKLMAATAVLLLFLAFGSQLSLFVGVPVGLMLYGGTYIYLRGISASEIAFFSNLIARKNG